MSEIHLQKKTPCFPRFSHLYSQCLPPRALSSCIMPPRLLVLSVSLPHHFPASPSLSFCVSYHSALLYLHRGAALTIRTLHTYADAHERSLPHTRRLARTQGDTRPPLPAPPLFFSHTSPLQTRNMLQPLVCKSFIKRHW